MTRERPLTYSKMRGSVKMFFGSLGAFFASRTTAAKTHKNFFCSLFPKYELGVTFQQVATNIAWFLVCCGFY